MLIPKRFPLWILNRPEFRDGYKRNYFSEEENEKAACRVGMGTLEAQRLALVDPAGRRHRQIMAHQSRQRLAKLFGMVAHPLLR